ncbi:MAG TPA: hypothetical protein VJT73_17920 [Polyangiaceae bacterium]|nr:hypothetical protein [Polyangiaceae bacterium]
MNLERLATLRGEAWARRVLRQTAAARSDGSERVTGHGDAPAWPGNLAEARRLAEALGKPTLLERLAEIIQERASATWRTLANT